MDYDNWSRCYAKSVFQAHGIDGARKGERSPPLKRRNAPAFFQKLQACLVGVSGLLVGARHIIDNQGAVSRCKAIPKLRPEQLAGDDGCRRARDDGRGPRFPRASRA